MSQPSELLIHFDSKNPQNTIECALNKAAAIALRDFMLPEMAKINPDYEGQLIGEFAGGVFSISDVKQADFNLVSKIILQAAEQLDVVKPFYQSIKVALMADSRFQAA
ncbi:glycine cleavage system H protein [Kingella negevensis]|uniref:glycine cleavage system H protein n=1 Tax=Kingella negevensis TaxID=1522312 RepID=UPI002543CB09|nr:glycine cleavage system H protein [Kingella negevensis]WII93182.1 glycine cleavage system H protein [Kingella negevensis]